MLWLWESLLAIEVFSTLEEPNFFSTAHHDLNNHIFFMRWIHFSLKACSGSVINNYCMLVIIFYPGKCFKQFKISNGKVYNILALQKDTHYL